MDTDIKIVHKEIKRIVCDIMVAAGSPRHHAEVLAEQLLAADSRGHYSHGLSRLSMYARDVEDRSTASEGEPVILSEAPATAWVDGSNLLGPVVGKFCMDLAIEKAKHAGVGWIAAKRSNHFGIAGWYAERAAAQGMLGMAFTNTSPVLFPTRSKEALLGTNPIAVCANTSAANSSDEKPDRFLLDMATSAVAFGKIEIAGLKGENIPEGWAVDKHGKQTTIPKNLLEDGGGVMPLGSNEITAGYKGYGLAAAVEVLCGVTSGSDYGPGIRGWQNPEKELYSDGTEYRPEANLGHCFIALNLNGFAPGFDKRLADLLSIFRNSATFEGSPGPVLAPGDPEKIRENYCELQGGVPYHPNIVKNINELAKFFKVAPLQTL